jgi:predicted ATP-grasp superfamily ATP-dependent carboligase
VRVQVLRERTEPLAALSRYVERSRPWPAETGEARVRFLERLAEADSLSGWALVPTSDEAVAFVASHFDDLAERFTLTTPRWEVVRWAYDKRLTYALADELGVACPRTAYAASPAELADVEVGFPAVLKPTVKEEFNRFTAAKAWLVRDRRELGERFAEACSLVDPSTLMIQELIPGGGEAQYSYAALCRDGVPLARLTAQRTRQYPADFGRASTFVETAPCPEIVEPSERLLAEMRFDGLIEIEYKRDPRDGRFKLLDMNPRVWGWHSLCGRAGIDFPYLLWLVLHDEPIPPTRQRDGIAWLRMSTDAPTAVREVLRRRLPLRRYLRSLRRADESAIFAWDDPLPGLCELPLMACVLADRLVRRRGI